MDFGYIFAAIFGAISGSYATLFIYRIPLQESCFGRYFGPKSRCPNCNKIIRTRELIPVLNWLFTLGKCVNCQIEIPKRYLIAEILSTIFYVICYHKYGFSEDFILYSLLMSALVVLIVTDWNFNKFYDPILYIILTISLVIRSLKDGQIIDLLFYIAIALFLSGIFYRFLKSKFFAGKLQDEQILQYTKFIIISSILLSFGWFIYYFILLLIFLSIFSFTYNKLLKKDIYLGFYMVITLLIIILQ
ncbi:prepilin peptidase [Rickettsiales bacterium]|nr:prepilin peptidase [Rickettsiales bacterium]